MCSPQAIKLPRILVIQHDTNAPAALLADAARAAGLALDIRLIEQGAPVPDRVGEAEAGLVVLGGEAGVYDAPEHPYLFEEMDLIQEAAEDGKPVLGICLGSQLAAEALGGAVRQGESGVEIGWVDVRVTEQGRQDPVAAALGRGAPLFQWHRDTFDLPPGSVPLLTADRYPVQGFRMGTVWAVQAHPEVDAATIALWCDEGGQRDLMAAGVEGNELLKGATEKSAFGLRVLESWCRIAAEFVEAIAWKCGDESSDVKRGRW
jgi:GMP synthase (glutamine-hydrolysing)